MRDWRALSAACDAAARHCWLQSPCVPVPKYKIGDTTEGRIDERHKRWMVRHGVWVRLGEETEVTDEWVDYVRPGERDPDSELFPIKLFPEQAFVSEQRRLALLHGTYLGFVVAFLLFFVTFSVLM